MPVRTVGRTWTALLMCVGLAAGEMALVTHWSEPASAKNGNSGGNGGGNGGGPGNGGGNSGNAGGGNNGGSNAGGNGSAHGNPGGKGGPPGGPQAQPPEDTDIALGLRNAGRIRALADVYAAAERQFGGKVIDARLVRDQRSGWIYDVRLVTEDGQLHDVAYRATNLALVSIDGEPVD